MGERGPVAEPDNVRTLKGLPTLKDGEGRAVRRLVLPPKAPAPPGGMGAAAAAEWRRVVPELARAGVLATVDRGVLTAYCTAWGHMIDAQKILQKDGVVIDSKRGDGAPVKHPAWQIYREANRTMLGAAAQCYLTPTARLRMPVATGAAAIEDGDDADDGWD